MSVAVQVVVVVVFTRQLTTAKMQKISPKCRARNPDHKKHYKTAGKMKNMLNTPKQTEQYGSFSQNADRRPGHGHLDMDILTYGHGHLDMDTWTWTY